MPHAARHPAFEALDRPARRPRVLLAAGLCGVVLASPVTRAALGEPEASVAADRAALLARSRAVSTTDRYTVHELDMGGTAVREFVSPQGVIFAVAWSGLARPDLTTLLGRYAAEYRAAREAAPRRRGEPRSRTESANVVVETWGHPRSLHGRAYLPSLLPAGVTPNDLT
jgi:Protein of unknown function (DUF2844)